MKWNQNEKEPIDHIELPVKWNVQTNILRV